MDKVIEGSQPRGVQLNIRERKLRSGVNWQGALKQNRLKQGLGVQASGRSTGTLTPPIDPLVVLQKLVTLYGDIN